MKSSSLTDALRIALPLVFEGHVSMDLLDYLCERVVENGTLLENCRPATLISLISALAIANYKPENWGCIKDSLLKNPLLQDEKLELPWIKISVNLALLDCFFNPLLERVFQENFLKTFLDRKNNLLDHLQLLTLYHAVFTLHPTYSGPLPPSAIMQEAMSKNGEHVKDFPLKGALERGLGGSCYLLTKVHTKLGHFVDHVVVMRKGGYPVAINENSEQSTSSRQFVEDLIIPPNSQLFEILIVIAIVLASVAAASLTIDQTADDWDIMVWSQSGVLRCDDHVPPSKLLHQQLPQTKRTFCLGRKNFGSARLCGSPHFFGAMGKTSRS
uniref:Uncharacterized protein n=1 Tax=Timema cristinae TaxID=61476 RepID=A0A7R9CGK7_TIMCR|nr:unnamed protein product [Timema cristinae]